MLRLITEQYSETFYTGRSEFIPANHILYMQHAVCDSCSAVR